MDSNETVTTAKDAGVPEIKFVVENEHLGLRLDQFLSLQYPAMSRNLISTSIRRGLVLVGGCVKKNSYRLKAGDEISGVIELPEEIQLQAERIEFSIIFEDDSLLLISKPPGLVVHPGSGNSRGTLVNGLLYHCKTIAEVGDSVRPGIVHRLDKDTSGIMVIAKSSSMHRALVDDFKNHAIEKEYLALVHGIPKKTCGRIVASIGRHPVQRQKMSVREVGGKHAATNWEVIETFNDRFSLLKVRIETGRTHQIRVHMAHLGFPVAGDLTYGRGKPSDSFPRQMLHAWRLRFKHPVTKAVFDWKADLWPDFHGVLEHLSSFQEKN